MVTGHNIPMGLRAAYLSMHRQTDSCFAGHGVTANQFVARRAFSDPNTIRAMLVLLEKRGLVTRQQHPNDGRARNVTITRKGRRTYERLLQESEPLRRRMLAPFQSEEVKMLTIFLNRLSEAMIEIE